MPATKSRSYSLAKRTAAQNRSNSAQNLYEAQQEEEEEELPFEEAEAMLNTQARNDAFKINMPHS